jgi:hypothetical protein
VALCACALTATSAAAGVTRPSVATGTAGQVSYASAVLGGSVNPNGSDTSYYFQYGVTAAYGAQSAIADAGAGTRSVPVALAVGSLQPLTLYHYRLVGVNAGGVSFGSDHTLLTTKVPLSLQILAAPDPVTFGGIVTVEGTLSGTGSGGRAVVLQGDPFPYTAGFQNIGNPELTTAAGGFAFTLAGVGTSTQYRVVTTTNPPVVSPVVVEGVAVRVTSHVGRASRPHHAVIYGTVSPAEDGMHVGILRIVHGRGVLVGGTILRHRDATSSSFRRVVPVQRGVYRVLVQVLGAGQVSGYGLPLVIG